MDGSIKFVRKPQAYDAGPDSMFIALNMQIVGEIVINGIAIASRAALFLLLIAVAEIMALTAWRKVESERVIGSEAAPV